MRVGPDRHQEALEKKHTKVFDITGCSMTGWVTVTPQGYADEALRAWIQHV